MSSENQAPLNNAKAVAEAEATIEYIHSMRLNNIGNAFSEQSLLIPEESIELLSYLNKNCIALEDFIISTEINDLDLYKLCQLNNIGLDVGIGKIMSSTINRSGLMMKVRNMRRFIPFI